MTIEPTSQFAQAVEANQQIAGRAGAGAGGFGGLLGGGLACWLLSGGSWWFAPATLATMVFVAFVGWALGRKAAPALARGARPSRVGIGVAFASTIAMGLFLGLVAILGTRNPHEGPLGVVAVMVFYALLFGAVPSLVLGLVFGALVSRRRQLAS